MNSSSAFSQRIEPYRHDEFEQAVARVETLARLMDSAVAIPGTNVRIGLDAAIGVVPVIGDLVSQAISSYIIWEARQLGVSNLTLARMIGNTALDTVIGMVPFAGDAFDVMFRANMKNLALLKGHIEKRGYAGRHSHRGAVIEGRAERVA